MAEGKLKHGLTWRLHDPGMGLLERAGLAALYMSLRAAEEQGVKDNLAPLMWKDEDLQPDSVTIRSDGTDREALTKLFEWAWQVSDGVLFLPAVQRDPKLAANAFLRVPTHNGILNTFLQHRTCRLSTDFVRRTENITDDQPIPVAYLRLSFLKPLNDLKFLVNSDGTLKDHARLASWVSPGFTNRYPTEASTSNWQDKPWQGRSRQAILRMLAPISCFYQRLPSQRMRTKSSNDPDAAGKKKPKWSENWVFIAPDCQNLADFDETRPDIQLTHDFIDVASISDATLRFAAEYWHRRSEIIACQAVPMGTVAYYPNQRVRKAVFFFEPNDTLILRRYQLVHQYLGNRYVASQPHDPDEDEPSDSDQSNEWKNAGRIDVPSGRGRIVDNLASGNAWYLELFKPLHWDLDRLELQRKCIREREDRNISIQRLWFEILQAKRQKGALMALSREKEMWDSDAERIFLQVMHDMLGTLMWKEARAAERRGGSRGLSKRIEDLKEKIRRDLEICQTRDLLREKLSKWLAKGGSHEVVRQNRDKVWQLMNDRHGWQKARDLALLSLITYEGRWESVTQKPDLSSVEEDLAERLHVEESDGGFRLRLTGAVTHEEGAILKELFDSEEDKHAVENLIRKSEAEFGQVTLM
ncbi:MAG: type I-MYXAN CRISPR-associated Cas8a1/Cmx1 [Pirellulaceae bacterium]|nr:MAG: type I-MYXAN CRISPR-associated Cas8a1/Cmx1 [Pirellulaceae bacterium]